MTKREQALWLAELLEDFAEQSERQKLNLDHLDQMRGFYSGRSSAYRFAAELINKYLVSDSVLD